jgi:hypothetical protein
MKEKSFEYLHLFGNSKVLTRVEYSKLSGIETMLYTSKTGSFEFVIYNKIKEMHQKKQEIPSLYANSNVLRLEYKIRKRKGIKAKFKRDLTSYDLFDENIYKRFQELFLEKYTSIEKIGRLVYADKSINMTPARLIKLQAECFRQSFPKDNRYFLQLLIENGKLSSKNLERIRADNYKTGKDVNISNQNRLIQELDSFIFDRMRFGI